MDLLNLKDELKIISEVTIPQLEAVGTRLIAQLASQIDRLDGARIEIIIHLKEPQNETPKFDPTVIYPWKPPASGTDPAAG
jgi:hypothetical protein